MREFSHYLREAREGKGMSLQQINDATKIRLCYLEAIESGDFDAIPGPVYLRGFLRSYATSVGLDPGEVLARFDAAQPSQAPATANAYSRPAKPPRAQKPRRSGGRPKWGYFGLAAALVLVAGVGLLWPILRSRVSGPLAAQVGSQAVIPGDHRGAKTAVALEVIASCWTEARVDGKLVFSGTLSPGDTPSWAGRTVDIVLGNVAGVVLTVNGKKQEIPGDVGERVELKFGHDTP